MLTSCMSYKGGPPLSETGRATLRAASRSAVEARVDSARALSGRRAGARDARGRGPSPHSLAREHGVGRVRARPVPACTLVHQFYKEGKTQTTRHASRHASLGPPAPPRARRISVARAGWCSRRCDALPTARARAPRRRRTRSSMVRRDEGPPFADWPSPRGGHIRGRQGTPASPQLDARASSLERHGSMQAQPASGAPALSTAPRPERVVCGLGVAERVRLRRAGANLGSLRRRGGAHRTLGSCGAAHSPRRKGLDGPPSRLAACWPLVARRRSVVDPDVSVSSSARAIDAGSTAAARPDLGTTTRAPPA